VVKASARCKEKKPAIDRDIREYSEKGVLVAERTKLLAAAKRRSPASGVKNSQRISVGQKAASEALRAADLIARKSAYSFAWKRLP